MAHQGAITTTLLERDDRRAELRFTTETATAPRDGAQLLLAPDGSITYEVTNTANQQLRVTLDGHHITVEVTSQDDDVERTVYDSDTPTGTPAESELNLLLEHATDDELDAIDHARERAGLIWICHGRTGAENCWANTSSDKRCDSCGAPRVLSELPDDKRPEPPVPLLVGEEAITAASDAQRETLATLTTHRPLGTALYSDATLRVARRTRRGARGELLIAADGAQVAASGPAAEPN